MESVDRLRDYVEQMCGCNSGRHDIQAIADEIEREHRKALHEAIRNALANGKKSVLRQVRSASEVKLTVHTFRMGTDKEAALKPLEEAAEVFGEWQILPVLPDGREGTEYLADEIADCIQACVNLAERYNLDLQAAMERCEERNRERGRYE